MSHPQVVIEEIIEGTRPVRPRTLNRVGSIGVSRKGRYGFGVLLASEDDLDRKVGRTLDMGSIGLQVSREEGASDQLHVRVMGRARYASASIAVTGTFTAADTYRITISDGVTPKIYDTPAAIAETALSVTDELIALINADSTSYVTAERDPFDNTKIILTAKVAGLAGNSITYVIGEVNTTPDDLTETAGTGNLAGGANGPAKATVTLASNTVITAVNEGVDGNKISYAIIPGIKPRTLELHLTDNSVSPVYTETVILDYSSPLSLINSNEFATGRASSLVRVTFTGADITTATLPSGTGFLAAGGDGPTVDATDYVDAARILGTNQANIIMAPGQLGSIRNVLLAQAENATILDGLRIAILNGPQAVDPTAADAATTGFDTSTGSAVMVIGWSTYASQPALPDLSVSPDCFYAGHLAATPTHVSPAARSSSPYFRTVVATDTQNTEAAFEAYTNARLEAIILDPATNGFHCLNGRTLSSDSAEYYVSIRRMANQIKTDLYFASQSLKSEPKTDNLLASIQGMVNGYLEGLVNSGKIKGGSVTKTAKTGTGVRIDFQWFPIYPADSIEYGMHRLAVDV